MSVRSIRNRLRRSSAKVGSGRFRVDAERALAKLRDFRLADPYDYVLELLRAAVAAGARSVEIDNDADDFTISFDAFGDSAHNVELT